MHGIRMRIDGEGGKVGMFPAELVHVAAHDQRIDTHKRYALLHFVIGISRGGKRGGDIMTSFIGHFFHTYHQGRFDVAGGNSHQSGTQRSRT